jgi:hypothetical protein
MSTVLAALDATAAARPVLETAVRIGRLTGAGVEVVHVRTGPAEPIETPESLAARSEVPFRVLEGVAGPALVAAVAAPRVLMVVIGARATPGGRRPIRHTASHILEHVDKPGVVVPPEVVAARRIGHLLLPLEGTEASSRPVLERLVPLLVDDVELSVLHVFTEATLPAMLDRPEYDLEVLGREFLSRHFPRAARVVLRPGPVAARVAEVARERRSDLVVLSWSQNSSPGRAVVVREVLGASAIPVLLLPVGASSGTVRSRTASEPPAPVL